MHQRTILTLIFAGLMLYGCQSSVLLEADVLDTQSSVQTDDPEYLGPRVAASNNDGATESSPPLETIAASPEAAPPKIEDGRPEWWYEGVRESEEQRSVCVEALARDLSDARRRAVLIARTIARELLGSSDTSEQILRTSVTPLPMAKGAEYRYVVYIEVSSPRKP